MINFDNIPLVQQPNMTIKLHKHQLASIYKMENLEEEQIVYGSNGLIKHTKVGLNCDCTGYGKTLSMLGLIVRDKMPWNDETPYVMEHIQTLSSGLIINRKIERYEKLSTNLILVSSSLVHQWENEIKNTELKYFIISSKRNLENIDFNEYDIVIVIPSMYNYLIQINNNKAWKRFLFDEPGHLRVSGMKKVIAGFYWLITATPKEIMNQHKNCRESFMKKILTDDCLVTIEQQFEGMIIKNDDEFVKASFNMPPTFEFYYSCHQPVLKTLSGFVDSTLHSLIESGNIEGAINHLGGKTKNLIELVKQNKLQKLEKLKNLAYMHEHVELNEDKLKKINNEISEINEDIIEIEKRTSAMLNEKCSICMQILDKPVLETNCQNIFCGKCFLKWLEKSKTCPLCRAEVFQNELVYLSNSANSINNNITLEKESEKITQIEMTIKIINDNKDGKFIIYSSNDLCFEPLCRVLAENNIKFTTLKGNYKIREKCIETFKSGDINVLLLNTNYNGSGLNLQEATHIIMYHTMSEGIKNQIIGRANRIGRLEPLSVHYLKVNLQ
jgi:SNF2 family DNA or RNA helicase